MEKTLKDLLKPPFMRMPYCIGEFSDVYGKRLFSIHTSEVFNEDTAWLFHEFVEKALNNEWERQYGEPKRWIEKEDAFSCPECNTDDRLQGYAGVLFNHCPSCGVQLLPPEGSDG